MQRIRQRRRAYADLLKASNNRHHRPFNKGAQQVLCSTLASSNEIARPVASSIMQGCKTRASKGGRAGCQSTSSRNCGMVRFEGTLGIGPPGATMSADPDVDMMMVAVKGRLISTSS